MSVRDVETIGRTKNLRPTWFGRIVLGRAVVSMAAGSRTKKGHYAPPKQEYYQPPTKQYTPPKKESFQMLRSAIL
ncbi:hypothetical protein HDU80_003551, partial [Chytriomyces hyalinus]